MGRVNAANEGFVSKCNQSNGSYVIYQFYKKYMDALSDLTKPTPFISDIFTSIQNKLHKEGKQLPESVWNADTKYLVFEKNKHHNMADVDMLQSMMPTADEEK